MITECHTAPLGTYGKNPPYRYVVVFSRYNGIDNSGKLLLSRHRRRTTWETQGGHIEAGETPLTAAKRELWEESGAQEYDITPLCDYHAADETSSADGVVFLADIRTLGPLPQSEMAEVALFDTLPDAVDLTYPGITPVLFRYLTENGFFIK
ncbi:MAG: NUDIX domain-containing protein [Clostridia bacterium]|nr:NUDIX domain-containing protein [Clostridia bacterium]